MTRLDALRAVYEAVKAGAATMHHFAAVWPSENAYGKTTWGTAHIAFAEKDVNAALAFIAATLPDAEVDGITQSKARKLWWVRIGLGPSVFSGEHRQLSSALLLAALAAHIAQVEVDG